jgi:hypothetical protein
MGTEHEIIELPLNRIKVDPSIQSRTKTHADYTQEFGEAMLRGDTFPPVVVFFDGKIYWLADGFHRHAGAAMVGIAKLRAEVRRGSRRDAIVHSAGANVKFSIPRTPEDIRRAIFLLLEDPEWRKKADSTIASHCGVVHQTVRKNRAAFCHEKDIPMPDFVENKNGTVYKTNRGGEPRVTSRVHKNGIIYYQTSVSGKTISLGSDKTAAESKVAEIARTVAVKAASKAILTSTGLKSYFARAGLSFEVSEFNREYPGSLGLSGHSCHCVLAGDDASDTIGAVGRIAVLIVLTGARQGNRFVILCRKTPYQVNVFDLVGNEYGFEYATPDELIESIKGDGAKGRA